MTTDNTDSSSNWQKMLRTLLESCTLPKVEANAPYCMPSMKTLKKVLVMEHKIDAEAAGCPVDQAHIDFINNYGNDNAEILNLIKKEDWQVLEMIREKDTKK